MEIDYFAGGFNVPDFVINRQAFQNWRTSEYQHTWGELDPEEQLIQRDKSNEAMRVQVRQEYERYQKLIDELPEIQRRRFLHYLTSPDGNVSEIARKEGISQKVCRESIQKSLAKLGQPDIAQLRMICQYIEFYDRGGIE